MPSFDIVSRVNIQEVNNATNQVKKELMTRYDFKNTKCEIDLDKENNLITIVADNKMLLNSLKQVLNEKLAKRGVSLKSLEFKDPENASGESLRQKINIKQGISVEEGKKIVKIIKEKKLKKIQAQIQQDQVRVTGPKKDELQEIISLLKEKIALELQFTNFKD